MKDNLVGNKGQKGRMSKENAVFYPVPDVINKMPDWIWRHVGADKGLSADLKTEFPEMKGFSPRNLKYMQRFAKLWPDETIVQRCVAQLPWRHIQRIDKTLTKRQ